MATFTNDTKHTATWTNPNKSDFVGVAGQVIGLLLSLTYASTVLTTTWSDDILHTASYTNDIKH